MEQNNAQENQAPGVKKSKPILRQFDEKSKGWGSAVASAFIIFIIIVGGIFTGYLLSRGSEGKAATKKTKKLNGNVELIESKKEAGIKDPDVFSDSTEGKLEVNDFSKVKEGSHKLLRVGGESQTAYLTSTVIDLNKYVGQCVQVWGETFSGKEAGWLMDVGRIKILDKCPQGL